MAPCDAHDVVKIAKRQVWSDLEQDRPTRPAFSSTLTRLRYTREKFVERCGLLQVPQTRSIR